MVEVEADDALGAAARVAEADADVEQAIICTPDKDLAQCVGGKVVQFDRRAGQFRDSDAVLEKYGVAPASIPDWLALVGDTADGFPGLPGWGAKTAATVLRRYGHLEDIPHAPGQWDVTGVRGAAKLAATLAERYDDALLFKRLATLDTDLGIVATNDVASVLTGNEEPPAELAAEAPEGKLYNPYFANGHWIGMPANGTMTPGLVKYDDRPDDYEASVDEMSRDVSAFLAWTAEPKMEERKRTGFMVMIYLGVLALLLYLVKKKIWADAH